MATTKRRSKLELQFEKILQDNEFDFDDDVRQSVSAGDER